MNWLDRCLSQRLQKKLGLIIKDYFPSSNKDKRKTQNEVFKILIQACPPSQALFKKEFWVLLSQNVFFVWTLIINVLLFPIIGFLSFPKIINFLCGGLALSCLIFQIKIKLEKYTFEKWIDLITRAKQV